MGNSAYIPDTGKWKVNKSSAADRVVIKEEETDWFDGEERIFSADDAATWRNSNALRS